MTPARSPRRLPGAAGADGRAAANQLVVARALGVRGTRLHRADWRRARVWGPAARRAVYDRIWGDAAAAAGATVEELAGDFRLIRRGPTATVVWFHEVQIGDPVTTRLALDKGAVHELLRRAGVPVPAHDEVAAGDVGAATAFTRSTAGPHVVKPARGTSGGQGVTCGVRSEAELRRALRWAHRWSDRVLIEQHVPGDEYRLLFLDGELLDVVRRRPPHVVGDGRSSVIELIAEENARRAGAGGWSGLTFLKVDLDTILTLDRLGSGLRTVPPGGARLAVKSTANTNGAGDNETVPLDELSPALVDDARRVVAAARLRLAGVDLVTGSLDRPLAEAGGAVIEVNATPGFHYHYVVAEPDRAVVVAVPVLEELLGAGDAG